MTESASCERVRTRMDPLLDGELAALEEARDLGHLEACSACADLRRRRAAQLSSVRTLLRAPAAELEPVVEGTLERVARIAPPATSELSPGRRFEPQAPRAGSRWGLRGLVLSRPTLMALGTAAAALLLLLALEQVAPARVSDARLRSADSDWPVELRELRLPRIEWPGLTPGVGKGARHAEEAG